MKSLAVLPVAFSLAAMAISSQSASAQSHATPMQQPSANIASEAAQGADPAAVSGPTIFVIDSSRHLAMINLGTKVARPLATLSAQLTDIAFNPLDHRLYGISYNAVYAIDPISYSLRLIARLGVNDANALVFDSAGTAYFAGYYTDRLYRLNVTTGQAKVVGSTGPFRSAGDLTFYNDQLVMAANYVTTDPNAGTANYLVTLSTTNAARIGNPVYLGIHQLYGLVSTGKNELYGLAGLGTSDRPGLYQLFPAAPSVQDRDTLLKNLSYTGLSLIVGAAYNGNYQP
jgi:hypothetical protein